MYLIDGFYRMNAGYYDKQSHGWALVVFLVIFGLAYAFCLSFGVNPSETNDADYARYLRQHQQLYPTAEYPQLQAILLYLLSLIFNEDSRNFLIPLRLASLVAGLMYTFRIALLYCATEAKQVGKKAAFIAVAYAMLNPYLLWTALVTRDFAIAYLCLSVVAYNLFVAQRTGKINFPAFLLLVLICLNMRVALLFSIGGFTLALGILNGWRIGCKTAVALILGLSVFLATNYFRFGHASLTSSSGFNVFLGNNPAYFMCHPNFDIDDCLDRYSKQQEAKYNIQNNKDGIFPSGKSIDKHEDPMHRRIMHEFSRSEALTHTALEYMMADKPALAERILLKGAWFLFGVTKVPAVTAARAETVEERGQLVTYHYADVKASLIRQFGGLSYIPYRISFLLLFWYATIRMIITKRTDLFMLPLLGYLAMLPVLVITFPDTRFYLAEMTIAAAAACSSVLTGRNKVSDRIF